MLSKCNIGVQTGVVVYYLVLKTTQQKLEKFEDLIDVRYEWWLEFNFLKKHCDLSIHYPQRERERERERERVGMHGRGSRGATPASDVATHEGRCWPRVGAASGHFCHVVSFFFVDSRRCGWDLAWFALNRADSCRLGSIGRNRRNRRNGRFKSIQAEIQTLSLTPSLIFLLCALCGVRVLGFTESLSTSLSLLSVSASPQQHNTNATLLARDKELQYKKTLITQNALCFVFYWTPSCTQSHVAVLVILPWCTCVGWDGYSAWSDMAWLGERVGHFFFVLCFLPSFFVLWI